MWSWLFPKRETKKPDTNPKYEESPNGWEVDRHLESDKNLSKNQLRVDTNFIGDGFKWTVMVDDYPVLESLRAHMTEEDAIITAEHWFRKMGFVKFQENPDQTDSY